LRCRVSVRAALSVATCRFDGSDYYHGLLDDADPGGGAGRCHDKQITEGIFNSHNYGSKSVIFCRSRNENNRIANRDVTACIRYEFATLRNGQRNTGNPHVHDP
jgi:hypothetical protein